MGRVGRVGRVGGSGDALTATSLQERARGKARSSFARKATAEAVFFNEIHFGIISELYLIFLYTFFYNNSSTNHNRPTISNRNQFSYFFFLTRADIPTTSKSPGDRNIIWFGKRDVPTLQTTNRSLKP